MTLDDRARAAADALHDEITRTSRTDDALVQVLAARDAAHRRRLPAIAAAIAVLALVGGVLAASSSGDAEGGEEEVAIELDPDVADGAPLQLLAPRDGRDSIRLPIVAEPSIDLVDGQTVHVTGSGFEPGESVGIVQCTSDARDPVYAGVDGCMISPYTSVTADAEGNIAGDYAVRRFLTTPYSGTIDCTEAPGRCIVAVGALSNYDRSGGTDLAFAAAEGGLVLPTFEVSQTEGLLDGQVVHVSGSGFEGPTVGLSVCSASPSTCWETGEAGQVEFDEQTGFAEDEERFFGYSLAVSADGVIEGDVPVWRFLPGSTPGTYIDCAVSTCSLRISSSQTPPPLPLRFAGSEPAPVAPLIEVTPNQGLTSGSEVQVQGGGFAGSGQLQLSLCARQPDAEASPAPGVGGAPGTFCTSTNVRGDLSDVVQVGDDGTFAFVATLGDFSDYEECFEECAPVQIDPSWTFVIEAYYWSDEQNEEFSYLEFPPPHFDPAPVVVGFTP